MVRRLLENSFISFSISCFISGGRLVNSSELMSTEFGLSQNSPFKGRESDTITFWYHYNNFYLAFLRNFAF